MRIKTLQKIIAGIAGLTSAIIGILSGATAFAAICYTNAILCAIYMEILTQSKAYKRIIWKNTKYLN